LSMWEMLTFYDYKTTLRYLAYLGFGIISPPQELKKSHEVPSVKLSLKTSMLNPETKVDTRGIFLCYVFGTTGSGKVWMA